MIKLWSLKQKKEESGGNDSNTSGGKKFTAAQLRLQKDLADLQLPKTCQTHFPDPDDLLNFKLSISPDEGFYKNGKFTFNFKVGHSYPHDAPKVKCETMVYHPNIDLEGNVCLNILREDWKPVLTTVIQKIFNVRVARFFQFFRSDFSKLFLDSKENIFLNYNNNLKSYFHSLKKFLCPTFDF